MKYRIVSLSALLLASCQFASSQSTPTSIPPITVTSVSITPTSSPYPWVTPISTAIQPYISKLPLPNGLVVVEQSGGSHIDVYDEDGKKSYFSHPIQPPFYGTVYRIRPDSIVIENSTIVSTQKIDDKKWLVTVTVSDNIIFETQVPDLSGYVGLMEIWGYSGHWALVIAQSQPYEDGYKLDIIFDGISISEANGYQEAFGFQLLDDKPFYFYQTKEGFGVSFDGIDSQLDYDEIPWHNRWVGFDYNPIPFPERNMILRMKKRLFRQ